MIDASLLLTALPAAGLCLVLVAVALWRRAHDGDVTARQITRAERARLREQRDVQRDLSDLLTQLDEVSRRVQAQVDDQLARLHAALRQADERIARLKLDPAPATETASPPAAPHTTSPATPPLPDRIARIHALADAGHSAATIAELLRVTLGEVDLVLSVRRYRQAV